MRGEGKSGGGWVAAGCAGETDRVTTQREATQAAAAQTSTRRGAIGYRTAVCALLSMLGPGKKKKLRKHVCARAHLSVHREPRGVEECAWLPKSHGVGPSVMDAQLHTDINRDAMQPPHDMYRVLKKKRIKYTICFPWRPPLGSPLFALPTVSEPTFDAKPWQDF